MRILKYRCRKPSSGLFATLFPFDDLHRLLFTELMLFFIQTRSSGSIFYLFSHTSFHLAYTASNSVFNRYNVIKVFTHFEGFRIDKCSCKIVNTLLSVIFNVSAIAGDFSFASSKTICALSICVLEQPPVLGDQTV